MATRTTSLGNSLGGGIKPAIFNPFAIGESPFAQASAAGQAGNSEGTSTGSNAFEVSSIQQRRTVLSDFTKMNVARGGEAAAEISPSGGTMLSASARLLALKKAKKEEERLQQEWKEAASRAAELKKKASVLGSGQPGGIVSVLDQVISPGYEKPEENYFSVNKKETGPSGGGLITPTTDKKKAGRRSEMSRRMKARKERQMDKGAAYSARATTKTERVQRKRSRRQRQRAVY